MRKIFNQTDWNFSLKIFMSFNFRPVLSSVPPKVEIPYLNNLFGNVPKFDYFCSKFNKNSYANGQIKK